MDETINREQMLAELMYILRNIETPRSGGFSAGGNQQPFFSGPNAGNIGGEVQGSSVSQILGGILGGMQGLGGFPGIGPGLGGALGGLAAGPSATTPYGGGGANLGGFGMGGLA